MANTPSAVLTPEIVYEGSLAHVRGGAVIPINAERLSAAQIVDQLKAVVCRPYAGSDVAKHGMTLIEAALVAAAEKAADGDTDALEKVLNRLCGKPIQQVANLSMTTTLKEFLDGIVQSNAAADCGVDIFSD